MMERLQPSARIVEWLRSSGVPLNPGAADGQIAAVGELLGITLPMEVQLYFRLADGAEDFADDGHRVSFWSTGRILSEREVRTEEDSAGIYTDVAFADFLISSWYFYFRARGTGISIFVEGSSEELPSFGAFVERYLCDPDSMAVL